MAASQPFNLTRVSQEGLLAFHKAASQLVSKQWNMRDKMREIDMAYLREQDNTTRHRKSEIANKIGDSDKFQNLTVPVIKPQVRSAIAYQAAVFLTDYPIMGVVADAEYEEQAESFNAVMEENSIRGSWVRELLLFFNDGFKYNFSALEAVWDKVTTPILETNLSRVQEASIKNVIWQGNCLKRWDPYNTYFDSRIDPYQIPTKGEFAGHTELMTRVGLKLLIQSLETKLIENLRPAFESPSTLNPADGSIYGASYYLPQINPNAFMDQSNVGTEINWAAWFNGMGENNPGTRINYKGLYEVSTEYVRIMPSDFQIRAPGPNTPQVWKLIWVNHSVLIYAERQTNAHDKIPVFFGCPSEDGLMYQTKSLAQDALPFQQVATALMNSVVAGRRRAATDRVLYDPSRVSRQHIESSNPSAKIPVRPSAYGKPVSESVYQFPFRDDQAGTAMQEIQAVVAFGNVLNGQNSVRQGQFVKGNKTDGQWENVMSNATSQDQITALLYEAQVFTPLKEVLKLNILQYQQAGTVYSQSKKASIQVDPVELRKAVLNFKMTDGLLPSEKVMSTDTLKVALQVIGSSESLAQQYNIGPLFSYIMKTENADLDDFEKPPEQIAYEQALMAWQQMAQLAIQKEAPFNVPQPLPQQYGYDPAMSNPMKSTPESAEGQSNGTPES